MPEIPDSAFRLKWTRTWPDGSPDDFIAQIGDDYCRIHGVRGGPQDGRWYYAVGVGGYNAGEGFGDTAREAALAAEEAYFKAGGKAPDLAEVDDDRKAGGGDGANTGDERN